jgi:peptide/nickel transport system substrate-binding protein
VIGWDISDSKYMDPGRVTEMSTYMPLRASYEALVTMPPGDYSQFRPLLATRWEPTADGKGLRFHLREGVKFASGNAFSATDVKFTYERVNNLKDQPAQQFTTNIGAVNVIDQLTVEILFKDPGIPMLGFIGSPQLAIQDAREVMAHGGTSAPDADTTDKVTAWLDQNSAGTGPYRITKWARKDVIELARNPKYWRGPVAFERVIIRHMPETSVQQLAIERGDLDLAFNLNPEQIATVAKNPNIAIVRKSSLD